MNPLGDFAGVEFSCSECFVSTSKKNVLRGLHFQTNNPQVKLINIIQGSVFDVVVDLRKDSETFGKWESFYLDANTSQSLLIPKGCAHGFLSLEDNTIMSYLCKGNYDKETDTGIVWDDSDLNILWPVADKAKLIISERDLKLMSFEEFSKNCEFTFD